MIARILFLTLLLSTVEAHAKLRVVTSFSILADVVKNITGPHAEVISIVGPNQDTHIFAPSPATNQLIMQAELVIINGLNFEEWLIRLIKASAYTGHVLVASDGIKPLALNDVKLTPDPHVWNDVCNVKIWVDNITKALTKIDTAQADVYKMNAQRYLQKLDQLEAWIHKQFNNIPSARRKIITAHDAFSYYGRAYNISFLAPMGLSTEKEPSAKMIAELIQQIRQEKITTLFVENVTNDQLIKQISAETGVQIGGTLYSDALSQPEQPAHSYVQLMRHNTSLFKSALQR